MMEIFNTILFELGGKPVLLIDLLSAVVGLTTVFLAGRNSKYNFYVGYMSTRSRLMYSASVERMYGMA